MSTTPESRCAPGLQTAPHHHGPQAPRKRSEPHSAHARRPSGHGNRPRPEGWDRHLRARARVGPRPRRGVAWRRTQHFTKKRSLRTGGKSPVPERLLTPAPHAVLSKSPATRKVSTTLPSATSSRPVQASKQPLDTGNWADSRTGSPASPPSNSAPSALGCFRVAGPHSRV